MEQTNIGGITTNPFKIIQATDKIGKDAQTVGNTDATFGVVAQVYGPNQIIMDTGYFSANELIGPHHMDIRWFSDISSGNGLILEYWRIDEEGVESIVKSDTVIWDTSFSDEYGNSVGSAFFMPNTQCRFRILSHIDVTSTQYVGVDFLKLTIEDLWAAQTANIYTSNGMPSYTMVDANSESIPVSGNPATGSHPITPTGWAPNTAYITATCNTPDYFATITNVDSSTFTITVTHRNDVSESINVGVYWMAMIYNYYISI